MSGIDFDSLTTDRDFSQSLQEDEEFIRRREERDAVLADLDRKKEIRTVIVPTDDRRVRAQLRSIGEPITYFGEQPGDRRDRLKKLTFALLERGIDISKREPMPESDDDSDDDDEFYTEGSDDLLNARRKMAEFSLKKAKERIARQKKEIALPLGKIVDVRKKLYKELQTINNFGSQVGDERPLSTIRFSPDSKMLLTASWSGNAKVWSLPNLDHVSTHRGHGDRMSGLAWHPRATIGQDVSALNFASGGADHKVKLWSLNNERPLATLSGHTARVCRVAFHPTSSYLASAAFDGTWRLWDTATEKELMVQEGHSKEVYAVEFQDDGALAVSGGFDAIGRVWDLRTGRTAMVLDGHVKEILSVDFAPNGYQIATGSGDDTVRIWDLRALKCLHTIPAHKSSVSDLRFFRTPALLDQPKPTTNGDVDMDVSNDAEDVKAPEEPISRNGLYLVTSGFDSTVRIWSADDWQLVKSLATNAGKVMSVDVSRDGKYVASASYNRSFHLFGPE